MPELPDVEDYARALRVRLVGSSFEGLRLASPFVLRSVDPPPAELVGRVLRGVSRLGKRLVLELEGERFVVIHLMIAGRLRWLERGAKLPGKVSLAALDFTAGTLVLTEASSQKRASLHLVRGREGLAVHDRGGLEVRGSSLEDFVAALTREVHTLKRALTDPRLLSGIGNAYSDEILHRARLSPMARTSDLDDEAWRRLHEATVDVLASWTERLAALTGDGFPERVTAFREGMAVHGRHRQACPRCGAPIQRIVYASNETNYCPTCQTGGRLLADRALSRLLGRDWPRTLEELEALRPTASARASDASGANEANDSSGSSGSSGSSLGRPRREPGAVNGARGRRSAK